MATITATSLSGLGVRAMTEITLTASDTLPYDPNISGSVLILRNPTAGAVSPTLTGNQASASIQVPGYGVVSAASGLAIGSIPAGAARCIPLDAIRHYLVGTVTITGGTGLVASYLQ